MERVSIDRRTLLHGLAGTGAGVGALARLPSAEAAADAVEQTDPTTRGTYRAVVDAVIPETPALSDAEAFGSEHEPGGLTIGLDAYLIEFTNTLFNFGHSTLGELGNIRLAELVGKTCDVAAVELLLRGENEATPDPTRFDAGGPFASLARDDRLRALALLDEKEIDTAALPGPVVEGSAGLIPQLLVAFTQVIYYSEWEGYDDISAPPSERSFSGDDIQSWAQTDFPGIQHGTASLRGYLGSPGSNEGLGTGGTWEESLTDGPGQPLQLHAEPGQFVENEDYSTDAYEEPFDTSGEPASDFLGQEMELDVQRPQDAVSDVLAESDEDLFSRATTELFDGEDDSLLGVGDH